MMTRVLLCGVCLIAFQIPVLTGIAAAQTLASVADNPVNDKPLAIDKTSKGPGNIPEIVQPSAGDETASRPNAVVDPGAVLTPPDVNLTFLRSIRLDWDQMGGAQDVTSR